MSEKIIKEVEELSKKNMDEDKVEPNSVPSVLYHYTNLSALVGIIETKRLWATHTGFLNDKSEVKYSFEDIIIPVMMEFPQNKVFKDILKGINELNKKICAYVTSFSRKGDNLGQWRGYGKGQNSVCIGFNAEKFASNDNDKEHGLLRKIEYKKENQEESIRNYLSEVDKVISKCPNNLDVDIELYARLLSFPYYFSAKTKCDFWEEEAEWRLIYLAEYCKFKYIEQEFRISRADLVPYYAIDPFNSEEIFKKEGISEIILPQSDKFELSKCTIREFLDKNSFDFEKIEIKESKIPIIY
ncbi:MAG: DUF2971 domain-containing protein [Fibromonadaceae bacterium]|nr:DUF2971 domain-containing protein [Fibromonadaceae bacterium]